MGGPSGPRARARPGTNASAARQQSRRDRRADCPRAGKDASRGAGRRGAPGTRVAQASRATRSRRSAARPARERGALLRAQAEPRRVLALRSRARDLSLELPAPDPPLDRRGGPRRRQRGGAQAGPGNDPGRPRDRRAVRASRAARRGVERRRDRRCPGPAPGRGSAHRQDLLHRRHQHGSQGDGGRGQEPHAGGARARRQGPPRSSVAMPTSTRRRLDSCGERS